MDIFRALSLGTTVRKSGKPATGGALPSAGSRANAQLYHDDVGATRGTKRKRADQGGDEESDDDDDDTSSLDFFAHKEPTKGTKKAPAQPKPPQKPEPLPKAKLLDEDECKQILRSHRLKFTLLSAGADKKKSKVKKSKKKAKASAKEVKPEKKQLFPQPLQKFSELRSTYHISPRLADNIDAQGYREPTEVQMAGLPLLLDPARALGNSLGEDTPAGSVDFMGVAPTGSGKTVSFLIPAINNIMKRRAGSEERGLHNLEAVIVAPTRELASQIHNEGLKLTAGTGVKVTLMRKGMRIVTEDAEPEEEDSGNESSEESEEEEEDSDAGSDEDDDSTKPVTKADILVTTPMLLLNFLNKGKPKRTIPSVRSLILDEADVLLDELFRDQTMGIWQACTSPDLHLTFWSATMGSNIETLATAQLEAHHRRRGMAPRPLVRLVVGLKDTAVPNVTHRLTYTATEPGKLYALRQLLRPAPGSEDGPALRPPFLVFTQTVERAAALHAELRYDIPASAGGAARIAVLHAALPGAARADVMRRLRRGEVWVLITTDVLARGVDLAGVNGVVNYDVPTSAAAYVHRAGRTGRAGREGGVAVTLYTKDDLPFVKTFANVIAMSERQAGRGESKVVRALLDALPDVKKEDRKKLKTRGVEARRAGAAAVITSKSGWERRREHNRREAIRESRKKKKGGSAE